MKWAESEKRREERTSKKRKSKKKEDPGARKGRTVAKHCVFSMICGPRGSKSRLAKAAGAELCGPMRDKSCTRLWRKAILETSATALCGTTGISLRYQRSCEIVGLSCVLEWILCLYKYESPRGSLASFHGKWFGPGTGDGPLLPVSNVWKERPETRFAGWKGGFMHCDMILAAVQLARFWSFTMCENQRGSQTWLGNPLKFYWKISVNKHFPLQGWLTRE